MKVMKEMENVYSSESRDAAPKVVIFRTASTSVLLVGTLTSISELLSFGYFKVVGVEQVLCFVWQGVLVSFEIYFLSRIITFNRSLATE